MGTRPLGSKEIDGLLLPPGKMYTPLTDHLMILYLHRPEPANDKWFKSMHQYI